MRAVARSEGIGKRRKSRRLRCAEGHAVARVLPSGTLVVLVVYVLVDTGVVYCDLFVLGLGSLPRKGSCETPEHEVLSSSVGHRGSLRAPLPTPLG